MAPALPPAPGPTKAGAIVLASGNASPSQKARPSSPSTTAGGDSNDNPEEIRRENRRANLGLCRSIFLFFTFLMVFTVCVLLEESALTGQLAHHLREKLDSDTQSLNMVVDVPTMYGYIKQVLVPALYSNDTDTRLAQSVSGYLHPTDATNWLLGGVRLRQVRVNAVQGCQVSPLFQQYSISCYPTFSAGLASMDSFGPGGKWTYSQDSKGTTFGGIYASYPPGGFMIYLTTNKTASLATLDMLNQQGFIDTATRAIFVDFTIWNANIGAYAAVTVVIEFAASGKILAQLSVLTLDERVLVPGGKKTTRDLVTFILDIVVILFVLLFLAEEVQEVCASIRSYFLDAWNVLDWVNMLLLVTGFVMRILLFASASSSNLGAAQLANKDTFVSIRDLAESAQQVKHLEAVNAVLLWLKVVKYFRHIPVVKGLIGTVWSAFRFFLPFLFMFTLGFVGFAMAYNVGFGDKIWVMSTFTRSFVYLCSTFVRDVKLNAVYQITPVFGAILILLLYATLVSVGLNVMFAMLADALYQAKIDRAWREREERQAALHEDQPVEELVREVSRICKRLLWCAMPWAYHRLYDRQSALPADSDSDGAVGFQPRASLALQDRRGSSATGWGQQAALDDRASTASGMSLLGGNGGSNKYAKPSQEALLRAIERMSGRIISEISIVGIEIQSELHDVCERVAQMQMAVEELAWRTDQVRNEQERELQK